MANIYLRSTDGNDADDGSTWALAKATLSGAAAIDAAGDSIYLSQAHSESLATAQTYVFAGTPSSPVRVICANDGAEPPTATATTAIVETTGSSPMAIHGSAYIHGVEFKAGTGTFNAPLNINYLPGHTQEFVDCKLRLMTTSTVARINISDVATSNNARCLTVFTNCGVSFGSTGQFVQVGGPFEWRGGSCLSGTSTPATGFFRLAINGRSGKATVTNVDFSNLASTVSFLDAANNGSGFLRMSNCKLPAAWTGSLMTGTRTPGVRAEMWNCDSGDTNYRLKIADYAGDINASTAATRAGGASDGATAFSWLMTTNSSASYLSTLDSAEINVWNTAVGSSKTVTVEVVHDGASSLNDDEIWLEVAYLGASGVPLGSTASDRKSNILASGVAQDSSTATWSGATGTGPNGSTNWIKQKLSVTFTPQEAGNFICRVRMAKASYNVYVDPFVTVT